MEVNTLLWSVHSQKSGMHAGMHYHKYFTELSQPRPATQGWFGFRQ